MGVKNGTIEIIHEKMERKRDEGRKEERGKTESKLQLKVQRLFLYIWLGNKKRSTGNMKNISDMKGKWTSKNTAQI